MAVFSSSQRLLKRIQEKGLKKTFNSVYSYMNDRYFDIKFNTDTFSWVPVNRMDVNDEKKEHAVIYQATRVLPLRQLFEKLMIPKDSTLVDIGCGKGRVLLVASEFGIEDIRGIEFSPSLSEIAIKNISKYKYKTQTKSSFQVINADAAQYQYEDDEDVFFLYNPFDEVILEKVLQNISASLKRRNRKVQMIYANAVHKSLIEKHLNVTKTRDFNLWEFEFVVYEVEGVKVKKTIELTTSSSTKFSHRLPA